MRLIHWKAEEVEERAERLRALGYLVQGENFDTAALRQLREDPPDAVVIDMGSVPSQGRDMGLGLRKYKATRRVPLVFVEGDPKKVERVRKLLPDATYTTWDAIGEALAQAIADPPAQPVVPESTMAGYAGTPLPKKLGIRAGSSVALVGAPEGFEKTLGELPEGVTLHREARQDCDVTLWFVRSRQALEAGVKQMGAVAGDEKLWIVWPKKASGVKSDLTQNVVREVGLAAGLVDYKVASVDKTWSGLLFTWRKR